MWSDMDYVARRAQAMSGLREGKKPTRLEQWLFDALHQIQIDFIPYAPVERFIADALIPIHKIIIEVDGERWHSQWKSRDILRDRILASYGYTTVRFSDRNLTSESTAIQVLINGIQEVINLQHSTGNPTPGSLYKVFWSRSVFQEKRRESSMNETPDIVLHSS
jgi:very-short-patch-repair endonuclease